MRLYSAFNPTDAPGAGVVNDAEALLETLRRSFPSLRGPRLFLRFAEDPRGSGWSEFHEATEGACFDATQWPTSKRWWARSC